jgi:hypothetical protein
MSVPFEILYVAQSLSQNCHFCCLQTNLPYVTKRWRYEPQATSEDALHFEPVYVAQQNCLSFTQR